MVSPRAPGYRYAMCPLRLALALALPLPLLLPARHAAAAPPRPPIVAVFEVQDKGAPLSERARDALTDFLAARLTSTGAYRTVPRSQIRERLTRLKTESYKDCYDQACQIELGRELAAEKAVSTRVAVLAGRCQVTLELYDLSSAATEFAHTARSDCSEAGLFAAMNESIRFLAAWTMQRAPAPPAPRASRSATVYIRSLPPGADVVIDGEPKGVTPQRLTLEGGRRYRLALHRDDFLPAARSFVADDGLELDQRLALSPEGRAGLATTSEWVGLGVGPAYHNSTGRSGFCFELRMGVIKWYRLYWNVFNLAAVFGSGPDEVGKSNGSFNIGTRLGFPLYLGSRGQHQLLFGLGVGAEVLDIITALPAAGGNDPATSEARGYLAFSPGLDYTYSTYDGLLPITLGVRGVLPVARDLAAGERYPSQLLVTLGIGFSLYRAAAVGDGVRLNHASRPKPRP